MPILAFPCLLSIVIESQHPSIFRLAEEAPLLSAGKGKAHNPRLTIAITSWGSCFLCEPRNKMHVHPNLEIWLVFQQEHLF